MLRYSLLPFEKISRERITAWESLLRAQPIFQSPYFRPEFMAAMQAIGRKVEVVFVADGEQILGVLPFERDAWNVGHPVGGTLCDFHGILAHPPASVHWPTLLRAAKLRGWEYYGLVPSDQMPGAIQRSKSFYLDLTGGFEAYRARRKRTGSETIGKTIRKARRLDREHGLRFEPHANDPHLFDLLLRWKNQQYRECGVPTDLAKSRIPELWKNLVKQPTLNFAGQLSVLWVGSTPAAIAYTLRSQLFAHVWFIGYDRSYATYSPGLILLLRLAEQCVAEGIAQMHLGPGEERFKTSLATDEVEVAEGTIGATFFTAYWLDACKSSQLWLKNSPLHGAIRWMGPLRRWWGHW